MSNGIDIKILVVNLLHEFVCLPGKKIPSPQAHLFDDLQAGDDLLDVIVEIEYLLKIKIPVSSWETVDISVIFFNSI